MSADPDDCNRNCAHHFCIGAHVQNKPLPEVPLIFCFIRLSLILRMVTKHADDLYNFSCPPSVTDKRRVQPSMGAG